MIQLKKCRIKNWDESEISPLQMIKDRITVDDNQMSYVNNALENKLINKRFHDEPKRIINNLVRWCQGSMGMYSGTKTGCLYREANTSKLSNTVVEHTVPVSDLLSIYFTNNNHNKSNVNQLSIGLLLFFPVCLLTKESNSRLNLVSKKNDNIEYPFRRYKAAGIEGEIFSHTGISINFDEWSIFDHFNLVDDTVNPDSEHYSKDLHEIHNYFNITQQFEIFRRSKIES